MGNTKAGGVDVVATGAPVKVNQMTGGEAPAQANSVLLKAGGADSAGGEDAEGAEKDKKGKRALPAQKAKKCEGEPIDVATGHVVDDAVDLALPGAIPVFFRRSYSSGRANDRTALGRGGFAHSFERWIAEQDNAIALRWDEGRDIHFTRPLPGESAFHRRERLTLTADRQGGGFTVLEHAARLSYAFAPLRPGGRAALRAIRDAYGHTVALHYEGEALARIVDTAGREIRITSDERGRAVRLEVWAAPPPLPAPPGAPAAPAAAPALEQWVDYAYHPGGELAATTDALGHAERYAYDGLHRMVKKTLKNGASFFYEYDDDLGWCVRSWGDGGLHRVELHPDLKARTTLISGSFEPKTYTWNASGVVVREETHDETIVRVRVFDDDLYLLSESNAAGETTVYAYDARGNRTRMVDPAGNATTWEYADDLPVKRIGPEGLATVFHHDPRGNLEGITYPSGLRYALEYDVDGRLTAVHGEDGLLSGFAYDAQHNVVEETSARGARAHYLYDALGRAVARTDALGRQTRVDYDRLGQRIAVRYPDGTTTLSEYGPLGGVARFTDAEGRVTSMEYAGTGVLAKLTQPDGQAWTFVYDADERVRTIKNPRCELHEIHYDAAGRVEQERTFDGRVLEYRYSKAERLSRIDYPDRTWREFFYDPLGNVVEEHSPHGGITLERDPLGRLTKSVLDEISGKIVNVFERDALGRVIAERQGDRTVRHEYDARGRVAARIMPDGETTRYYYDPLGALIGLDHDGHKIAVERDALGRETRKHIYQGRVDIQSAYDVMDRLVDRRVTAPAPAGGGALAVLSQRRWSYDAAGRVGRIDDTRWGTTEYAYDAIGRLIEARRGALHEIFEYDVTGSLTNALSDLGQVGRAPPWFALPGNVLTKTADARYENDERGRRIKKTALAPGGNGHSQAEGGSTHYLWDCRDRLREVRLPSGERVLFTYDAFGRRVRKEVIPAERSDYPAMVSLVLEKGKGALPRTRVVEFLWDGDVLAADIEEGGARARIFVHEPGTFVPVLQAEQGEVFTYVNDHLGTPRELLDPSGRVAWAAAHSAWASPTEVFQDPKAPRARPVESPLRTLGQYADRETGLSCTRFRYFDAETARWMSPDPIGLAGGTNLFGFNASPTTGVDPFGLACPTQEQVDHAVANIQGLTEAQARLIMTLAFKRNSSAVFGGSRVRGNSKETSDLDVGFGGITNKNHAQDIIKAATKAGPLPLERTQIIPGNGTDNIPTIQSPEEFFARSGVRSDPGRKGEPFSPSGSITYNPDGTIVDNRIPPS